MNKQLEKLLSKSNYSNLDVANDFNKIIEFHCEQYDGKIKDKLKSFFEDLQKGGCISGLISEFIYHTDCKRFYVDNIDELEEMRQDLEDNLGEAIQNRHNSHHYTFMCWLCFEEYCYSLYNVLFEN